MYVSEMVETIITAKWQLACENEVSVKIPITREEYMSMRQLDLRTIGTYINNDTLDIRLCYSEITKIVYDVSEKDIESFCVKYGIVDAIATMTDQPIIWSKCYVRDIVNFITSTTEIKIVISHRNNMRYRLIPPSKVMSTATIANGVNSPQFIKQCPLDVLSMREAVHYECTLVNTRLVRELIGNAPIKFRVFRHTLHYTNNAMRFAVEEKRLKHTTMYAFHVEQEAQHHPNSDLFAYTLYRSTLYTSHVLGFLYFRRNYDYIELTEIFSILEQLSLRRPYQESRTSVISDRVVVTKGVKFTSWKLDGTRGIVIITPTTFVIVAPNSGTFNVIKHDLVLGFYYIGYVEILSNGVFVLIDVIYCLVLDDEQEYRYEKLSIHESINFMENLTRLAETPQQCGACNQLASPLDILAIADNNMFFVNRYFKCRSGQSGAKSFVIPAICSCFRTDGILMYKAKQIIKHKSVNSIDLRFNLAEWLVHIYTMAKLPKKRYRAIAAGIQPITLDMVRPWLDNLTIAPSFLTYYDPSKRNGNDNKLGNLDLSQNVYVNFTECLGSHYSVNWTPRISDFIINPEYQYQYIRLIEDNKDATVNTMLPFRPIECLLRTSITIEFSVDRRNKMLHFLRIRHKPNCNTVEYIRKIV
ncbi:Lef-4 protein [Dolichomitus sp. PSUC_FEM 10030005]|nr:Lef-4 protein [Dolichomitus sp. PSUC_FEM 10030005]